MKKNELKNLQHERLVHLLVMLTMGICFVLTMELALVFENEVLSMVGIIMLFLLVPWVFHYFKLENQVQGEYKRHSL